MTARKRHLPQVLILTLALLLPAVTVAAKEKGFKAIVKHLESTYQAKRRRIPMLGLARFVVKIVRPAGVKDLQIAIFEDQDFSSHLPGASLDTAIQNALTAEWKPLLRVRSQRGEREQVYVYAKASGKEIKVMVVSLEPREAVVVEAKTNPEAVMKYLDKPETFGKIWTGGGSAAPVMARDVRDPERSDNRNSQHLSLLEPDRKAAGRSADSSATSQPKLLLRSSYEPDPVPQPAERKEESSGSITVQPKLPGNDAIRIETRLVNLNVKAVDKVGQPLTNLSREDFVIFEDGIQQEIAYFDPVTAPINLVLLLDLSGSTKDKREVMVKAAQKFIDALSPKDRVAVAAFTRQFFVLSHFTTDRRLLKERIEKVKEKKGGTAFYDAMWTTLDLLREVKEPRKAIVVLTDGVDESLLPSGFEPSHHTFAELLERVAEEEITIYPINLNTEIAKALSRINRPGVSEQTRERLRERLLRPNEIASQQLAALAEQTAGMVFKAEDENELEKAYERVATELRLLYSLAYYPANSEAGGGFRKIQVQVNRAGAVARTRRGYYVK